MASNEHHIWFANRDWLLVLKTFHPGPDRDLDLLGRKYKERDEYGRLPHHWLAAKAQKNHIVKVNT